MIFIRTESKLHYQIHVMILPFKTQVNKMELIPMMMTMTMMTTTMMMMMMMKRKKNLSLCAIFPSVDSGH
jgi:hypothetical protein